MAARRTVRGASTSEFTRGLRWATAAAVTIVGLLGLAVVRADNDTSVSCSGTPEDCYSADLQKLITDCIAANMANPPAGNPGPFTRGYSSIVVLGGQCFAGGFAGMTGIGDNVVVGSAATKDKQSTTAGYPNDRMLWWDAVVKEIKKDPTKPIKDILDAVDAADPDPDAMTPAPSTSNGGAGVVMGDPGGPTPGKSFHAVLFAGVVPAPRARASHPNSRYNVAYNAAINDMKKTLTDDLKVPAGNVMTKIGGTYADLQAMITATWSKMNDNEQFILGFADHGGQCCEPPIVNTPSSVTATAATTTAVANALVPRVRIQADAVLSGGEVRLNGGLIGFVNAGQTSYSINFIATRLNPPGVPNVIEVVVPPTDLVNPRIALASGPIGNRLGGVCPGLVDDFEHADVGLYHPIPGGSPNFAIGVSGGHDGHLGGVFGIAGNATHNWAPDFVTEPGNAYRCFVRATTLAPNAFVQVGVGVHGSGGISMIADFSGGRIVLEDNRAGFGSTLLAQAPFPFLPNTWYQMELDWQPNGDMQVRVYDEAGAGPLANTPGVATGHVELGGISIKGASTSGGSVFLDTIAVANSSAQFNTFCLRKGALACGPALISACGLPSATADSGFIVQASPTRGGRTGVLMYNTAQMAPVPFQGGELCVESMGIRRGGPTNSQGAPGGCNGAMAIDMNAFAQGVWSVPPDGAIPQNNPAGFLLNPGTQVFCQYWGRDSQATGSLVSDGLSYVVGP